MFNWIVFRSFRYPSSRSNSGHERPKRNSCSLFGNNFNFVITMINRNNPHTFSQLIKINLNVLSTSFNFQSKIKHDNSVDIEKLAKMTVGFSGADLENMVNTAAIRAAVEGHWISSFWSKIWANITILFIDKVYSELKTSNKKSWLIIRSLKIQARIGWRCPNSNTPTTSTSSAPTGSPEFATRKTSRSPPITRPDTPWWVLKGIFAISWIVAKYKYF